MIIAFLRVMFCLSVLVFFLSEFVPFPLFVDHCFLRDHNWLVITQSWWKSPCFLGVQFFHY